MKKILFTILTFSIVFTSCAQKRERNEKIEALKIAFITEQLNLTKTEAQQFWPIYNAFEEQEDLLRKKSVSRRKEKQPENLTEKEAKQLLLDMMEVEEQTNDLKHQYITDLLTVLPATKVINLFRAEHDFKRKMFEEFKKRRGGGGPHGY